MRCFFEISLPQIIKDALSNAEERLIDAVGANRASWVKKENMHITLAFLGHIPEKSIGEVIEKASWIIMDAIKAPQFQQFNCTLEKIEAVPQGNPRIIWCAIAPNPQLSELHASFKNAFNLEANEEKANEKNEFIGHITLGRIKHALQINEAYKLKEALKSINRSNAPKAFSLNFEVQEICLMESILKPEGPQYRAIKHWRRVA